MQNYVSLGTSPNISNINYNQFNDGGLGGLGGTRAGVPRSQNNDAHEKREIIQNSGKIKSSYNPYSSEKLIDISRNSYTNSILDNVDYQCIVLPFYRCIIDIVILNDLHVEIVDSTNIETKNKVLCQGKIRKYRFNGAIQNYDLIVEMMNENVFHVKKRGIMMRVHVSEELRRHIVNTMVNYVGDGGDVIKDTTIDASGGIYTNIVIKTNKNKNKKSGCFKCFGI
jgi:hypothetical protein